MMMFRDESLPAGSGIQPTSPGDRCRLVRRWGEPSMHFVAFCLVVGLAVFHQAGIVAMAQDAVVPQPAVVVAVDDADKTDPKPVAAQPATTDGQADLDEAMIRRIDAETPKQLQAVITLLESALAKGLNEESQAFAKKMVGSIRLERAQGIVAELTQGGGVRARQLRSEALQTLRTAIESDPGLVEAHLLIARLNLLPEGDMEEARRSAGRAVELLAKDPKAQSNAYLVRALCQAEEEARKADFDLAVQTDPTSSDARQARALYRLRTEDVAGAVEDFTVVFKQDPTNQAVAQVIVEQLVSLGRTEDALELLGQAIEASPSEGLHRLRGLIYRAEGKEDEALAEFGKALKLQPKDAISLLQRAEISLGRGDVKAAKGDLEQAIRVEPRVADSVAAVRVRCYIAVEEGRLVDAINDMSLIVQASSDDPFWKLQLASLYVQDKRPRKAIELTTEILEADPDNTSALRSRADTLLGLGQHAEAIRDYERAIELGIDDPQLRSGILNNLAWVLATSTQDDLRSGSRALQFGKEAAELTEFKEPHILSTLAAAYAESGDFDEAVKWSGKAVALARELGHDQLEQLEEELQNFKAKKPWREKQETKENKAPLLPPEDLIDT